MIIKRWVITACKILCYANLALAIALLALGEPTSSLFQGLLATYMFFAWMAYEYINSH